MVHEMGQRGKIVIARVLDDEDGAGPEQMRLKHLRRYFGEAGHIVGGIGKYNDEGGESGVDVTEYVAADEGMLLLRTQFAGHLADEVGLRGGFLYRGDMAAAARQKFKRYGSRAGEKVERRGVILLKVHHIFEDVEDILACEVGGGSRGDIGGDVEASSPVFSSDYSHSEEWITGLAAAATSGATTSSKGAEREAFPARNITEGKMAGIT